MEEKTLSLLLIRFIKAIRSGNRLTFVALMPLFLSCSNQQENLPENTPFQNNLKEFQEVFPVLMNYEWEIHSAYESEDKYEFDMELDGKSGDTTIVAALDKWTTIKDDNFINSYSISRFIKTYQKNDFTHQIHTIGGQEVLFHYYYNGEFDDPENRIFVKGKYRYLYDLGVLDSLQTRYYLANRDSLNQIEGDNLKELPTIK